MKLRSRGNTTKKLSRIPKHQEFKSFPRKDLKRLPRGLNHQREYKMSSRRSKIQIAKRSEMPRDPRCLDCKDVKIIERSYMSRIQGLS